MKVCIDCGLNKPLRDFHKSTTRKDGRGSRCKPCACERARKWRADNPARSRASVANYHKKNAAKCRAMSTRWYAANRERQKKYGAQYRKDNAEQCKETIARWHAEHPEERRATWTRYRKFHPEGRAACQRRRRARARNLDENFTVAMSRFLRELWHTCGTCGSQVALHLDHWLPLSKGHALTMANAVLLCGACNRSKCAKLPTELYSASVVASIEARIDRQLRLWSEYRGKSDVADTAGVQRSTRQTAS